MRLLPRFRRKQEGQAEKGKEKQKRRKGKRRGEVLQPGITVLALPSQHGSASDADDAQPRAPAEEVYGCFVQFDPAIIPEDIHIPRWMVSAVRGFKNNVMDPLNPLTHRVAEVDHKLPFLDQRPDRSTVELTEPAIDMVQITVPQKRLDPGEEHYDRSHKPSMPVFKPGFRTIILVEGIICYIVMGTQW